MPHRSGGLKPTLRLTCNFAEAFKGKMMKSFSLRKIALAVILAVLVLLPLGCAMDQGGETAAEGSRRHRRVLRINRQGMLADIDRTLLLDKPSKLTGDRIP